MKLTGMKCAVCDCTQDNGREWADDNLCAACAEHLATLARPALAALELSQADVDAAARAPMVTIQMDFGSALGLLGAIQLACRTPGFTGSARSTVELIGQSLEARVSVTPAWAKIAASGWRKK
jgi:hypothetical protein